MRVLINRLFLSSYVFNFIYLGLQDWRVLFDETRRIDEKNSALLGFEIGRCFEFHANWTKPAFKVLLSHFLANRKN